MPQHGAHGARVTIHDVARLAEVSRQTVSNALSNPEPGLVDTLARVRSAVDELGYQPSSSAQSLRSQRSGAIGLELNTLGSHNETMAPVLTALASGCPARLPRRALRLGLRGPMIDGYQAMWRRRLVDAFIIADTHHGDPRPRGSRPRYPVRHLRPGLGRPHVHPVGRRRRRGRDPGRRRALPEQGYAPSPSSGGPRARSSATTGRRAGWPPARRPAPPRARWPVPCRTSRRRRLPPRRSLCQSRGDAVVCASDVLALGVHQACCGPGGSRDWTSASSASTAPRPPRCTTSPRSPSPTRRSPTEALGLVRAAMRGATSRPRAPARPRAAPRAEHDRLPGYPPAPPTAHHPTKESPMTRTPDCHPGRRPSRGALP